MNNILSKKLLTTGGALGSICYIAGLVAAGTLPVPIGLIFAALAVGVTAMHLHTQGKIDLKKSGTAKEADGE